MHVSILAYSLHVNDNPGNLLSVTIRHFLTVAQWREAAVSSAPSLPRLCDSATPSPLCPPCALFIWILSEHTAEARLALPVWHDNPFCCRTPAPCVLFLQLSDTPFTDRAVFRDSVLVIFFTVIAKCWHAGILTSSHSQSAKILSGHLPVSSCL